MEKNFKLLIFFPCYQPAQYHVRQIPAAILSGPWLKNHLSAFQFVHFKRMNKKDRIFSSMPPAFMLSESDKCCCKTFEQTGWSITQSLEWQGRPMITFHASTFTKICCHAVNLLMGLNQGRTLFMEDIVYGYLTLIRKTVKKAFRMCRNLLYSIFYIVSLAK